MCKVDLFVTYYQFIKWRISKMNQVKIQGRQVLTVVVNRLKSQTFTPLVKAERNPQSREYSIPGQEC